MSEAFSYVAQVGASYFASYGVAAETIAYYAIYAAEIYALNRVTASLGASKPSGEGRGMEVSITDTGQAAFAIYGAVRVSGINVIPDLKCQP